MNRLNTLKVRLRRKWAEHPSIFSFLGYAGKYSLIKVRRVCCGWSHSLNVPRVNRSRLAVAVRITGGLGDAVVHRRVLEQIAAACPGADFYLFCPVVAQCRWVFANAAYVKAVLPLEVFSGFESDSADVSLTLNTFAFFNEEKFAVGKTGRLAPALLEMFRCNSKKRRQWDVFIDNHPILDGAFARQAVSQGFNRRNFIPDQLGLPEPPMALDLPLIPAAAGIKSAFPAYVTINTGFDAFFVISGSTATKCYPAGCWEELTALLKARYPQLGIVQIGNRTSPHIRGVDFQLAGKTSLEECAGILKESRLHFDIEGGLVHICAALGTRCVTLFGPTSLEYFGYPQNLKLRDAGCPDCWWSTERWMECCPRKYPRAECMYRLTPEKVLSAAAAVLDEVL